MREMDEKQLSLKVYTCVIQFEQQVFVFSNNNLTRSGTH